MDPALDYLVPANPNQSYDMKVLIHSILDGAEFMEIQARFARNIICGFGRLGGQTIGLIANQPAVLAGVLDSNASIKAARFVRFCDAFNIPLICLVDVPGFMPGPEQEHGGIIRHGAKLLYAFVEATVPRIIGYRPQSLWRGLCGHEFQAYPLRHQLCLADSRNRRAGPQRARPKSFIEKKSRQPPIPEALLTEKTEEYRQTFANPFLAAQRGYIDDVIFPRDTRHRLIRRLQVSGG